MSVGINISAAPRIDGRVRWRLVLAGVAGLAVGASASAIFGLLLAAIAVHERFPNLSAPGWTLVSTVIVLTFLPGVAFALLVAAGRQESVVWWRTLLVGVMLPLAGAGGLILAARLEPLGTSRPGLTLPVFRLAFVSASGLVAFICTVVAAWAFHIPGGPRRALQVAGLTSVAYLLVALALDTIPGFHVGGGNRAMPKVAALCNFVAGMLGGSLAFRVLLRGALADRSIDQPPEGCARNSASPGCSERSISRETSDAKVHAVSASAATALE